MTIWAIAFGAGWAVIGLPTDPLYAFVWLWSATIAWNSDRPWRHHLRFGRDWMPVVLLLIAYNFSRGFADNNAVPHVLELIASDRAMFGEVPTIWLQERLYVPTDAQWWEVLVSFVYFSHFVAAPTVAVVLWLRNRPVWAAFVRRWITLTVLGLITYFAYPAAPPWWASKYGLTEDIVRISTRGWKEIGLHGAGNMLNAGQIASNPVAAMPSLHTAYALLVVAFFLPRVSRRWWPLLLAYPLAMAFTLMYTGEHWFTDVLAGWAYTIGTLLLVWLAERWWARRKALAPGALPQPYAVPPAGAVTPGDGATRSVDGARAAEPVPAGGARPADAARSPAEVAAVQGRTAGTRDSGPA